MRKLVLSFYIFLCVILATTVLSIAAEGLSGPGILSLGKEGLSNLVGSGAAAPTFYISNTGSDANNGTSTGSPWQTVAKVNAVASCVPGTTFAFQAGGTWHEELIVPCSGTAGNNVVFTSYGAGANPIITGADVVGGGGWTNVPVSALTTSNFAGGSPDAYWTTNLGNGGALDTTIAHSPETQSWIMNGTATGTGANNGNVQRTGAGTNSSWAEIDFLMWVNSNSAPAANNIARVVSFEGSAWTTTNGVILYINFTAGGAYQLALGRGAGYTTGLTTITAGAWHTIRMVVQSNGGSSTDSAQLYIDGSSVSQQLTGMSLTSTNNADVEWGVYANQANKYAINFTDISLYNTDSLGATNKWTTALTTQPFAVIFNESQNYATMAPQVSQAAISATNQWFWAANVLSVFSVGNPASTYTAPGIQAAKRNYVILRNGKSYWTVNNLIVEGGNQTNGNPGCAALCVTQGAPGDTGESSGVQFGSGIEARYNGWEGAWLDSIGGTVSGYYHDNLGMGIDFDTATGMTGTNIRSDFNQYGSYPGSFLSMIHNLTLVNFEASHNLNNGLSLSLGVNYVISGCNLSSNNANGLLLDGTTVTGAVISGCIMQGNGDSGVFDTGGASVSGLVIQSSLLYGNTNRGIFIEGGGSNVVKLFNNVLQGNGTGYQVTGANTTVTAENNITYNNTIEAQVDTSVTGALTLNFNDYFHNAGGNFMTYHGVAMTFALWKTTASQDASSISIDPLFTSVPSNFTLQGGSLAIAAGTPLTPNINTFAGIPFANPPSMGAYGP